MASILQTSPYPWTRPEARQLHVELTRTFPNQQDALRLAAAAGFNQGSLFVNQAPALLWQQILNTGAPMGLNPGLAQAVHDELPTTAPLRSFLADLLADKPVATSGEQRSVDGTPSFVTGDDRDMEPEALLFRDDLTLEIGRLPAMIATLQRLVSLSPGVCKVTAGFGGSGHQFGTAFRIGPDLLLTNWHVVHRQADKAPATSVAAEFRFEDDGRGGGLATIPVPCDAGGVVSDEADDWAVVRATTPLHDDWPVLPLAGAPDPAVGETAFVIQHPLGGRKRVAYVRNTVSFFDDRVVHYLSDTQVGSSGSPVLDAAGRIIALHHAGGRPQTVTGKDPVVKNEGMRIPRIVDGLAAHGVALNGQ
jgi:V8-like Glu-specific endopeptidase